jgi:hypothetical protein
MQPIWFSGGDEMKCISDLIKTNWTLNYNYWTSGAQQGCWGEWGWCQGTNTLAMPNDVIWLPDQPDNSSEGCLSLRVFKNGSNIALSDKRCLDKFVMACKAIFVIDLQTEIHNTLFLKQSPPIPKAAPKCTATCPTNDTCKRDVGQMWNIN